MRPGGDPALDAALSDAASSLPRTHVLFGYLPLLTIALGIATVWMLGASWFWAILPVGLGAVLGKIIDVLQVRAFVDAAAARGVSSDDASEYWEWLRDGEPESE